MLETIGRLYAEMCKDFKRIHKREPSSGESKDILALAEEKHREIEDALMEIYCRRDNGNQPS